MSLFLCGNGGAATSLDHKNEPYILGVLTVYLGCVGLVKREFAARWPFGMFWSCVEPCGGSLQCTVPSASPSGPPDLTPAHLFSFCLALSTDGFSNMVSSVCLFV